MTKNRTKFTKSDLEQKGYGYGYKEYHLYKILDKFILEKTLIIFMQTLIKHLCE